MSLSINALNQRIIKKENFIPTRKIAYFQRFIRNPYIIAFALKRSKGKCELCQSNSPFSRPSGMFYLEVHHIISLSKGGKDSPNNVAALCPNCHRMLHHGIKKNISSKKLAEKIKKDEKR